MSRSIANRKLQIANAFTLVELLVVIGIIALLMGILLPVINSVRKAAYGADSKNQIRGIANAIDRYYTEQSAYPGVFSNASISTGKTVTGSPGALTSTENCVLALTGGIATTATWTVGMVIDDTTAYTYTSATLGRGPLTFNNVSQKRLSAYMEVTSQVLSTTGSVLDQATSFGLGEPNKGVNTGVPEFIDRFPGSMPIIYMRARIGAANISGAGYAANAQFDTNDLVTYTGLNFPYSAEDKNNNGVLDAGEDADGNGKLTRDFDTALIYFTNSGTGQARQKDTYILISPGPDRKYGTSDDLCNFSF